MCGLFIIIYIFVTKLFIPYLYFLGNEFYFDCEIKFQTIHSFVRSREKCGFQYLMIQVKLKDVLREIPVQFSIDSRCIVCKSSIQSSEGHAPVEVYVLSPLLRICNLLAFVHGL